MSKQINNEENKTLNLIVGIITLVVIIVVVIFLVKPLFSSDKNTDDKETTTEIKKEYDQLKGTWYKYDRDGIKVRDTYIELDGEGYFKGVTAGYVFHSKDAGDYYKIDDSKVKFYNSDNSLWLDCTLSGENKLQCIKSSSIEIYKR